MDLVAQPPSSSLHLPLERSRANTSWGVLTLYVTTFETLEGGGCTNVRIQVGLDTRGVGLSNQVQCDPAIYAERVGLFLQTEEELAKLKDKNRRFGESCLNRTGRVFEHLDTIRLVECVPQIAGLVSKQTAALLRTMKPCGLR